MNKHWLTLYMLLLVSCFAIGQAPTGFSGTGYRTTVHLKWDGYTAFQPVGYNIYRSTVSNSFGAPERRIGAYTDYTDYNLNAATTYFYKISAFDAAGNESALSNQITVATNSNNYLTVASLDLLIPIYTGGMGPNEPNDIRDELEFARQFYFRNTKGQLNLKFHFMEIAGYPPPNNDGVADFGTIGTDLHDRGILDNQYDAIHVSAYQTYGFWGGAMWLGQTAGSMAHQPAWYYNPNNHYTTGDAWVFVHEFGHSLDMMANQSGFGDMIFNHFPWAFPLPAGIDNFDAGPDYDGMALVLRLFDHHLDYAPFWDGYIEVTDSDGDKLANNDARLPMDEARFGSSPATDDSDLDGLTDAKEYYAGIYGGSNPTNSDTDGDDTPDGTDPYPISNFRPTLEKTTAAVNINGTMAFGEGWQPLVSNPNFSLQSGATFSASATWDDAYLYFAFQSNMPMKYYLYMDGSGEDGIFSSSIRFEDGTYPGIGEGALGDSYYESAVIVIRSDAAQAWLKNAAVTGSQVATANAGGTYTTEVRIPHNLGPGFGYTYTPPTAPVVTSQSYTTGDIIGVNLVALPLANANGNETDDWRISNMVTMNEPFHFYDMTLTGGGVVSYCASTSNFPWEDWVAKVKIGTLDNASGKSPYSDFTSLSTSLSTGSTPIELTTGFSYFTWDEYWRVWVDLNHDGDFTDAGETVFEGIKPKPANGTATSTLTGNISIPATALAGATRMRVTMKRGAYAMPCETLAFGEIEDYTVNITSTAPLPDLGPAAWEVIPGGSNYCYTAPGVPYGYLGGLALNNSQVAITMPFTAKAWLSKDDQISADDILWQTFNYTGVGANNVVGININSPVPAATPQGIYYILVKVDADNAVSESDETNNIYVITNQRIGTTDFVLQNLTGAPASIQLGGSFGFSVQVKDLANFPFSEIAGELTLDAVLSPDNVMGDGNDIAFASQTVNYNQFAAGNVTINMGGQVAGNIVPGSYYLLLKANANCETNYQNNNLVGPMLNITSGGGTPGTYCTSTSNFPWEDWIAKVQVGSFSNASGKSIYSDFTNQTINLPINIPTSVTLTTGFSYFTWDEYWRVWIDYNHDGVFSTPDEIVQQWMVSAPTSGTPTSSVTGSINVPTSALTGPTRMRVSMKRGALATACETLPFGEVEDYTVNIGGSSGCSPDLTPPVIAGCPGNITVLSAAPTSVNWTPPTATDNCSTPTLTTTHQPGAIFQFGTTTVTYTAKDVANNTSTCSFMVTVNQIMQNLPDLTLTNLVAPASGTVGSVVNFTFKLNNIGNITASGSYVIGEYLSTDDVWSQNDVLAGTVPTGNTPVNFNTTVPAAITVPAGMQPGNYYLICVVDNGNVINESNENNNTVSAAFQVTSGGGPVNYCNSYSNFPWEDWISRIKLNTLDNTSGKSMYSDFTALNTNLQKGQSYTVTLTTGYSYFTWDEYWRVWIDFNHDGVFSTPDELVQQRVLTAPAAGTATASVTGSINIPTGALLGTTRMRVSMKRGSYASACETLPFGEVEDYTVNITNSLTGDDTDNRATSLSFEAVPEKTWVNLAGAYHFVEPVVQIEVEKSLDGNDYEVLETLQGKAIADNSQVVQVRDEQPKDGFNYYRMLVLFGNGDEVYSPVRVVSYDEPMDYTIFPNPATSEVFIQLAEAPEGEMQWNINDAYGRVVWSQKIAPDAQFPYRIDVTDFRDGMYYLFAQQLGRRAMGKRFVITR